MNVTLILLKCCNPCYNGIYFHPMMKRYVKSVCCNPCYNGIYFHLGKTRIRYIEVVILVIMEYTFTWQVIQTFSIAVVILVIMEYTFTMYSINNCISIS